jgi:hypothetical protein
MKRIREEEKLDEWADDSLQWLQDTFGKENIVSAVLHGDETTSHVHAALIPIVTGERRKADKERADKAQTGKKTYRKKSTNTVRLCADDVLTRDKMKDYQTSYAERMAKYGLERGVEGSKARYKITQEYYRELYLQQQTLKEDIGKKERQKSDIEQQYTRLSQQADEKTRELEETRQTFDETKQKLQKEKQAVKTAEIKTKITGTVSSLLGTPKCRQLEQEVESLRHTIEEKEESYQNLMQQNEKREQEYQNHIRQLQKLHADKIREKESESSQLQKIIEKLKSWMPKITDFLSIEKEAKSVGFSDDSIKKLIQGKSIEFSGKLWSEEHNRRFETDHSVAKIEEALDERKMTKLRLTIDGLSITEWCRERFRELSMFRGRGVKL